MATFLLIRHATNDFLGKRLAGRNAGLHLNQTGLVQAERVARRLTNAELKVVYTSPLERAQETALLLAKELGAPLCLSEEVTDTDYGEWTGRFFVDLREDPRWERFKSLRSCTRPPGGELVSEVQMRVTSYLERLCRRHRDEAVAIVTHADIIKVAIGYYAGIPLDFLQRIEIGPASISELVLDDYTPRILRINDLA